LIVTARVADFVRLPVDADERLDEFLVREADAAASALQVLGSGEPGEPLKARADALNWDIDRAVQLLTG
jgi:hypothetical protein